MASENERSMVRYRQSRNLLAFANQKRNDGLFNDIIIKSGDEDISANKLILSCFSRFFEELFKSDTNELQQKSMVEIPTYILDTEVLKTFVDYIYAGRIIVHSENVFTLLDGAEYLQLDEVKQFCFDFLQIHVTPDSSLHSLKLAKQHRNEELREELLKFINKHLDEVTQTKNFNILFKEELTSLFLNLDRDQVRETSIYQAAVTWCRYDLPARKTIFPDFFKLINVNKLPVEFLKEIVLKEELVISDFECEAAVRDTYRKQIKFHKLETNDEQNQKAVSKLHSESKILCFGGRFTFKKISAVYNLLQDDFMFQFPQIPEELLLKNHCTLKLNGFIYCLGGEGVNIHGTVFPPTSPKVWRLDLTNQPPAWKQMASMNQARGVFGAAVYRDTLVVAGGGSIEAGNLSSTEFYISPSDEWKTISPLHQKRGGNALVACDIFLYALGGSCKETFASVERLDDLKSPWKKVQSMQTPRCWLAGVNCRGKMYAIGGASFHHMASTTLKSVEVYNSATDQWSYVSDMNFARKEHAACVLRGKIYVVGGIDTRNNGVKEIECYDPSTDTWMIVGTSADELYSHAIVAV